MRKVKDPSMSIQIGVQLWLIFKLKNYRVFIYLKYLYLVTKTIREDR